MPVQVILPIGFIKELTNEGAAFKITDPETNTCSEKTPRSQSGATAVNNWP